MIKLAEAVDEATGNALEGYQLLQEDVPMSPSKLVINCVRPGRLSKGAE